MSRPRPLVLAILDGFGERAEINDNAVRLAKTPSLDALYARYPHTTIGASGPDVGLPPGQMGNSEVGHLGFGAGRIVLTDVSRIDAVIASGKLPQNPVVAEIVKATRAKRGKLHLLGLASNGRVHSSIEHLFALIEVAYAQKVDVVVHAFLDGRDVQPGTAWGFLERIEGHLIGKGRIGTVCGRYWAMDRDNRWDRVERAYRAIVRADATWAGSALEGVCASFDRGKSDEFVEPFIVADYARVTSDKDVAIHFNFRPDRARELTRALAVTGFHEFPREHAPPLSDYACMTVYDKTFELPVAFPKEAIADSFPEVISRARLTQLRCAETEKYAHVTYFFNGGVEDPFPGEERKMIPSPRDVATYDKKPQMSAAAVTDAVVLGIEGDRYDFILVNFANPDMVGHTGVLGAAVRAVEEVDTGIGRIVGAVRAKSGAILVTADHGNCELMKDPATGEPHTSHTTNPVPLIYVNDADRAATLLPGGRICDVAPTMLELLKIPRPSAMTGHSLLSYPKDG
jgi:2,3-bisphosphoglycerate-independent phosphoglycerate mutase